MPATSVTLLGIVGGAKERAGRAWAAGVGLQRNGDKPPLGVRKGQCGRNPVKKGENAALRGALLSEDDLELAEVTQELFLNECSYKEVTVYSFCLHSVTK